MRSQNYSQSQYIMPLVLSTYHLYDSPQLLSSEQKFTRLYIRPKQVTTIVLSKNKLIYPTNLQLIRCSVVPIEVPQNTFRSYTTNLSGNSHIQGHLWRTRCAAVARFSSLAFMDHNKCKLNFSIFYQEFPSQHCLNIEPTLSKPQRTFWRRMCAQDRIRQMCLRRGGQRKIHSMFLHTGYVDARAFLNLHHIYQLVHLMIKS